MLVWHSSCVSFVSAVQVPVRPRISQDHTDSPRVATLPSSRSHHLDPSLEAFARPGACPEALILRSTPLAPLPFVVACASLLFAVERLLYFGTRRHHHGPSLPPLCSSPPAWGRRKELWLPLQHKRPTGMNWLLLAAGEMECHAGMRRARCRGGPRICRM